jgi:hypothetical protein
MGTILLCACHLALQIELLVALIALMTLSCCASVPYRACFCCAAVQIFLHRLLCVSRHGCCFCGCMGHAGHVVGLQVVTAPQHRSQASDASSTQDQKEAQQQSSPKAQQQQQQPAQQHSAPQQQQPAPQHVQPQQQKFNKTHDLVGGSATAVGV